MAHLPPELAAAIAAHLQTRIYSQQILAGGCIHNSLRLKTAAGLFFVKWNRAEQAANFAAEADGLQRLAATQTLAVPHCHGLVSTTEHSALLLAFIPAGHGFPAQRYWQQLGEGLAQLHQHSQVHCGLERDNFIGSLPQRNRLTQGQVAFFTDCRLRPLIAEASQRQLLPQATQQAFERLLARLPELLPEAPPALLHGDLWSGNVLAGPGGRPWVFDPAVYYGHPEAELAFTQLFGGFPTAFYQSYQSCSPLASDWQSRSAIWNLYPLLVHLLLFGESYLGQIQQTLKPFN